MFVRLGVKLLESKNYEVTHAAVYMFNKNKQAKKNKTKNKNKSKERKKRNDNINNLT